MATTADKNYIPPYLTPAQLAIINADVPENLVFTIEGHKYVNHSYIVNVLNKAFGGAWTWNIIDQGIEEAKPFKSKYSNDNGDQAKTYYAWVLGELSVPITNPQTGEVLWIKKQQYGAKTIVGNSKVQSQSFKSASSDAFKKAASMLGVAKNVYMQSDVYQQMLIEESDADSWTADKIELFAAEIEEMKKLKATKGEAEFNALAEKYCQETGDYSEMGKITPSNICNFLQYVSNMVTAPAAPAAKPKGKLF